MKETLHNRFMKCLKDESDSLLRANMLRQFWEGAKPVRVNGERMLLSSDTRALLQEIGWQRCAL